MTRSRSAVARDVPATGETASSAWHERRCVAPWNPGREASMNDEDPSRAASDDGAEGSTGAGASPDDGLSRRAFIETTLVALPVVVLASAGLKASLTAFPPGETA